MTKIHDLFGGEPTVSFEFFPPKTPEGAVALGRAIDDLSGLDPTFVSVTYGAGGATRSDTRDLVVEICADRRFPAMAHLTCVSHTRAEMAELLDDYARNGVANILALAGDPPVDGVVPADGFRYASELVELCRARGDFSVGVAAFPEVHPRSASRTADRRHLAAKLEAADFAVTQFFFDSADYERLVDELDALGVRKPVVPGIIPVTNPASVRRFADMNGTAVPENLWAELEAASPDDRFRRAIDHAIELSARLVAVGAPGIHLYSLNQAAAASAVVTGLGLRA